MDYLTNGKIKIFQSSQSSHSPPTPPTTFSALTPRNIPVTARNIMRKWRPVIGLVKTNAIKNVGCACRALKLIVTNPSRTHPRKLPRVKVPKPYTNHIKYPILLDVRLCTYTSWNHYNHHA